MLKNWNCALKKRKERDTSPFFHAAPIWSDSELFYLLFLSEGFFSAYFRVLFPFFPCCESQFERKTKKSNRVFLTGSIFSAGRQRGDRDLSGVEVLRRRRGHWERQLGGHRVRHLGAVRGFGRHGDRGGCHVFEAGWNRSLKVAYVGIYSSQESKSVLPCKNFDNKPYFSSFVVSSISRIKIVVLHLKQFSMVT